MEKVNGGEQKEGEGGKGRGRKREVALRKPAPPARWTCFLYFFFYIDNLYELSIPLFKNPN
jgi:hypothetical protein